MAARSIFGSPRFLRSLPQKTHRILPCSVASSSFSTPSDYPSWDPFISTNPASQFPAKKTTQIAGVDQNELLDPWLLADADSRFAELQGVQLHYKIANPDVGEAVAEAGQTSQSLSLPAILLHGFGASLFSWERVLKPLARMFGRPVIAFDRPAFGLTSRVKVPQADSKGSHDGSVPAPSNPYSLQFSSKATISFIDFLQSQQAILIGHSAGCIVAADAYLKFPERIAAMVMIAPALLAPVLMPQKEQAQEQKGNVPEVLLKVLQTIMWAINGMKAMLHSFVSFIGALWYKLLTTTLRSGFGIRTVRIVIDKLGLQAVRLAWFNKERVDNYVISGYTKPLKCKNWDYALLEYAIALLGDSSNLTDQLSNIRCPVLVITGDSDSIVPAWNADRLAKVLPNAQFHVLTSCGHVPQEEKPDECLTIIQKFIAQVQNARATVSELTITVSG